MARGRRSSSCRGSPGGGLLGGGSHFRGGAGPWTAFRRAFPQPIRRVLSAGVYPGRLSEHNSSGRVGLRTPSANSRLAMELDGGFDHANAGRIGRHRAARLRISRKPVRGARAARDRARWAAGAGRAGLFAEAQRAWVVDAAHGGSRPMRRIHPAGLYEAVVEQRGARISARQAAARSRNPSLLAPPYQLA